MPASAQAPSILIVDDDEGLLILMAETLRAEGYEVATADSAATACTALRKHRPDLMLLDLKLKDSDRKALADLEEQKDLVPFVVVTGQGDEKVAVDVMKQGALDYVMKDSGLLDLLPTVVKRALNSVTQEKALTAAQLEHRRLEHEVLEASERERQSIGADLHDGLGQQLTAIELMCTTLKADAKENPLLARGLDRMGKMLREAIAQTRFLARGLVPVGREPDALQNGLTELLERINAIGALECEFDCPQPVLVNDPAVAGHLYRIAQEAVNNAVKHARAKHVTVRLKRDGDTLLLEVADDGAGLTKKNPGVGLGVMRHRAKVIGGELDIVSKRGGGVKIVCRVPLPE